MTAVHLIRDDAQSLQHESPEKVAREETIVAAEQEACWYVGPRLKRPRLFERST
jgi:hypothetical protein